MKYHRQGFTIVELLIVVVVIAILAAITIVSFNGITTRSKDAAVAATVSTLEKKIQTYRISSDGRYPTLAQLNSPTAPAGSELGSLGSEVTAGNWWSDATEAHKVRLITDCDPPGRGVVIQYYNFTTKTTMYHTVGSCDAPADEPL